MTPTTAKLMRKTKKQSQKSSEQLLITPALVVITGLEQMANNRRVTIIHVDQLPWKTVATRVVKDLELAVGQGHQSTSLSRRIFECERRLAISLAIQLLSYRIRSRREIADKLCARKISPDAIEQAIARLEAADYLDDAAFTHAWIKERINVHGFGRQRIKNELLAKGVDREMIESELAPAYTVEDEIAQASKLALSRLTRYKGLDVATKRRRLTQVLMRRGFSAQVASSVLSELP